MKQRNDWYVPSKPEMIAGYRAVKNRVSGELGLFGLWGEVWQWGDGVLGVMVYNGQYNLFKKVGRLAGMKSVKGYQAGDEFGAKVPEKDIHLLVQYLEIPMSPKTQAKLANTSRHLIDFIGGENALAFQDRSERDKWPLTLTQG